MATWFQVVVLIACLLPSLVECRVREYKFNVVMANATRLCSTKPIVTVNGQFPGPTIYAREDDTVLIKVVNHVKYNLSIHWHGVRQLRTGWADGPAYITQCPIQPGQTYVYNFTITGQRGTLWWHAHILWLRATLHGALVILPKPGVPYPFPSPHEETIVILGHIKSIEFLTCMQFQFVQIPSLRLTIVHAFMRHNYSFWFRLPVDPGKKYMLRIINAALNDELFFKIAGHNLTIVEVDAAYVKPFTTDTILIAPGQTTNAIVSTDQESGKYLMAASPFMDAPIAVDNLTATATLRYSGTVSSIATTLTSLPSKNATPVATKFMDSLRSLNSQEYPAQVPLDIDHSLLFTISIGINPCATLEYSLMIFQGTR
ncbi:unnamed protein product [Coffea canephora]|uniref:laccase n=1 Tax=Coffea canephora TaxID=49390 RepID=A0A068ULP5_COFCA|nr:unnamed protein product [Coffea canephora]